MQQEQIAKSVLLNLFWQHIIVKLSNVFKNDTEFYFVMIKQHPPGLIKKSPRRGIEPRSGTRQAPILTIKLSRKKQSTHDGGRTHNLLIRSQTRCHYATRAKFLELLGKQIFLIQMLLETKNALFRG